MFLTTLAGKAQNEGGEGETYKGANPSTAFIQRTCGFVEIPFQT